MELVAKNARASCKVAKSERASSRDGRDEGARFKVGRVEGERERESTRGIPGVREKKNLISPFAASYFGAGMAGDNYMVAGLPSQLWRYEPSLERKKSR